jgi:hypothetical protein
VVLKDCSMEMELKRLPSVLSGRLEGHFWYAPFSPPRAEEEKTAELKEKLAKPPPRDEERRVEEAWNIASWIFC